MQHHHRHPARVTRAYLLQPDDVPQDSNPLSEVPDVGSALVQRDSGESGSSGEKPTSTTTTTTLPVVLGAVVPIVVAIIVLIYLHRRNVKKLRSEDANDKHGSLDFGLDLVGPATKKRPMQEAEKGYQINHTKGVSLDQPYLLPPGLDASQDSFHSPLREDDRYRRASPVTVPDNVSINSHPNTQRMSRASHTLYNDPPADNGRSPVNHIGLHFDFPSAKSPSPGPVADSERHSAVSSSDSAGAGLRKSNAHLASAIHRDSLASDPFKHPDEAEDSDASSLDDQEPGPVYLQSGPPASEQTSMPTPRISLPASDGGSDYSDHRKTNASIPAVNISGAEDTHDSQPDLPAVPLPEEPPQSQNQSLDPRRDTRRMTFGLRPLPPEDPTDNPEQRANRIRSFYKEYFDESKTGRETYYEDYGPEYYPEPDDMGYDPALDDYDYYDPVPAPFAEPVTRRAMTPPPRAPPRFQGHMAASSASGWSGFSGGSQYPGPRAFSSASNRLPQAPRRPAPPPAPLNVLPTPHMLRDDAILGSIDFAPGNNYRDQREGRSETPLGGMRPFSPMARVATPLASAFDELSAVPSPHALRKSGAFSNLDFAPPPRFKNAETASDAGSIRSQGTGISNTHMYNIRNGAYRISRLPTGTVGTRDDMASELRPKWDMRA